MDNQEKMQKWLEKARRGDKDFIVLNHGQDGWSYREQGQQDDVTMMLACIWEDDLIHLYHKWDQASSANTSGQFLAVVKDTGKGNTKMMIATENAELFTFGLKDGATDRCQALIFAQCDWLTTIIAATSDPAMVLVQHYIQDGSDPLAAILTELFDILAGNSSRKGGTESAGETRPSDSVDLGTGSATGAATQA